MTPLITRVHKAISAVAPIDGVSIKDEGDKTTWRIDYAAAATSAQRAAGDAVLAAISIAKPGADDVRAECQRRIMALVGVDTMEKCTIKQLNALMRGTLLTNKKASGEALTAAEEQEAAILEAMANAIAALRAASNVMEPDPPIDYLDDDHWS